MLEGAECIRSHGMVWVFHQLRPNCSEEIVVSLTLQNVISTFEVVSLGVKCNIFYFFHLKSRICTFFFWLNPVFVMVFTMI